MDTFVLIILGILVADLVLLFVVFPCILLLYIFWLIGDVLVSTVAGVISIFMPVGSPSQARSSNVLPTK
jgi:hypothetical protein